MRRLLLAAFAAALFAGSAEAKPPEVSGHVAAPSPIGCARYGWLLADWYDAELWSDSNTSLSPSYALSLTYLTRFSRSKLTEISIDEMARLSGQPRSSFQGAEGALYGAFRDVSRGDRFTAARTPSGAVQFYFNGAATGDLGAQWGDLFLSIWLSADTRLPGPRRKLLSGNC